MLQSNSFSAIVAMPHAVCVGALKFYCLWICRNAGCNQVVRPFVAHCNEKSSYVDLGFLPDIVGESIGCKGGGEKSGARVWAEAHEEEEEDGFHLPRKSYYYEWESSNQFQEMLIRVRFK